MVILSDTPAERAVLSGICQFGNDVFLDVVDILQDTTFTDEQNSIIFKCVRHALKDDIKLDIPTIHSVAKELGFGHSFNKKDDINYLQGLFNFPVDITNIRKFSAKIRKLEIARLLNNQLENAQTDIIKVTGNESVTQILSIAENAIFDFTSLLNDTDNNTLKLGDGIEEYIQYLIDHPVEQIGLSTGFPAYDQAIGGGLRGATVNVICARAKQGKSIMCDNIGYHITNNNIPVLNLDTELTKEDHIHRTLALMTEVPINDIETSKFTKTPHLLGKIKDASTQLSKLPYHYKSIAGKPFEEQLALMRRWVMKEVGLNSDGSAKPCLIIYDYIKLMSADGLSKDMKEYQLLGFMMTSLHNFATRYKLPILALAQTNRDGIDKENSAVISGSDRIIWLCSNFSIFKEKSNEENADDQDSYNRKLIVVAARHGAGMDSRNYINMDMKGWCAKITEGPTKFEAEQAKKKQLEGFEVVNDEVQTEF
jgi:replicative DNA helicase